MTKSLHVKYRPDNFDDVVGQDAVVNALARVLERGSSQSFLFAGPSGTGKTTLARISAHEAGCEDKDIMEIDAATHTGVDAMRAIQDAIRYKPFGKSEHRAVIIDECHRLSGQAWDSLLKALEEPPEHVVWFLCTTNMGKVPVTVKTRCATFTLKLVADRDLVDLIEAVALPEKIKLVESVRDMIVKEALGSPRQALVNLELCRGVKDRKEAADLLRSVMQTDAVIELCRFLQTRGSWSKVSSILAKLAEESPEGVRIVVCNYYGSVLKNAKSDREVCAALPILEAFATPYNQSEGMAPLFLSVGRVLYADN